MDLLIPATLALPAAGFALGWLASTVTRRRLRRELTEALARGCTDPLTGLANRSVLTAELERLAAARAPYATIMIDLDGFKAINDAHGHAAGDAVLVELGRRLTTWATAAPHDEGPVVVTRLGGDEFVLILPAPQSPAAVATAERVRALLAEPVRLDIQTTVKVTASLGVALAAAGVPGPVALRAADLAMYRAKASRGSVVHVAVGTATAHTTANGNRPQQRLRDARPRHQRRRGHTPAGTPTNARQPATDARWPATLAGLPRGA